MFYGHESFITLPPTSLSKLIYDSLSKAGAEEILYINAVTGEKVTFKTFYLQCCRLARALVNAGYKQNDVIVVSGENSAIFCIPIIASLFVGIISAPLNYTYTQDELSHLISIAQPKIIFCTRKALNSYIIQKEKSESIERIILLEDGLSEKMDGFQTFVDFSNTYCESEFNVKNLILREINPIEQVAIIMCSSGTSGMPKGVMLTHDNIYMRINQLYDPNLNLQHHEILCAVVPYFHICGLMMNLTSLIKRNTVVYLERFDVELFLRTIERYGITNGIVVPTIVCMLIKSELMSKFDLSSVEELICAGAALSQEIEQEFVRCFPKMKTLRLGFGMTETTFTVLLTPTGQRKIGSSGKVVPHVSVYIRDVETGKMLGPNQTGELCVKGRFVCKGYYNNPEATNASIKDGWLFTGDLGYYDEEGYFFIVDRLKELIKYNGFQVPPAEVESVLLSHPKVQNACVVGKPNVLAGELPTAFIVKKPQSNVSEEEIVQYVADRISKPKQLHGGVYFVDELPKTSNGKVMRKALKNLFLSNNTEQIGI